MSLASQREHGSHRDDWHPKRPWRESDLLNTSWWIRRGLPRAGDNLVAVVFTAWIPRGIDPKTATRVETRLRRLAKQWASKARITPGYLGRYELSAGIYPRPADSEDDYVSHLEIRIYLDAPSTTCDAMGVL